MPIKLIKKHCARRGCPVLGVGPHAGKLYPLDDQLWCKDHFREQLDWHESRSNIALALQIEAANSDLMQRSFRARHERDEFLFQRAREKRDWRGLIEEWSGLAGWALSVGDRRSFVYYFARAVWAWRLSQEES